MDERKIFLFIVFLIPFQIIESKYGSLNFLLTVLFFVAVICKYQIQSKKLRLMSPLITLLLFGILIAQLLSLIETPRAILVPNFFYIVNFIGNFVTLFLVVNLIRNEDDVIGLIYCLALGTFAVILYCFAQGILGLKGFSLFGIQELSMKAVRGGADVRVLGPFQNTQSFVGYMVLQSFFMLYCRFILSTKRIQKIVWSLLLFATLAALVASSTRTGILSFALGFVLLVFFFARNIRFTRTLYLILIGSFAMVMTTYLIVTYTPYNFLIDRLEGTEVSGIEVDSRKGLIPAYLHEIKERPLFGHRPMVELPEGVKSIKRLPMPHNLYIYLLYSIGSFGFLFFMSFFAALFLSLFIAGRKWVNENVRLKSFPGFCKIVFFVFLVQQYFISFNRWETRDYQQYIFLLFGLFCALPDIAQHSSNAVAIEGKALV